MHLPCSVAAGVLLLHGCALDLAGSGTEGDASADAGSIGDGTVGPDGCRPGAELCNASDDDCDGATDEGFDLDSDPSRCGTCDTVCPSDPPMSAGVCRTGRCELECDAGWEDCDGVLENGCEARLSDPATCGSCSTLCETPTPLCAGAMAGCVASCPSGQTDCGGSCVDTETDTAHCGSCDTVCSPPPRSSATCAAGTCGFVCDPGFGDCDADTANGCESPLTTLMDCGGCGVGCAAPDSATATCTDGTCGFSCLPGVDDCDGRAGNGCENDLSTPDDCGACGTACPTVPGARRTCSAGTCGFACSSGRADCNAMPSDGCEADLSSRATCGDCMTACGAGQSCSSGSCTTSTCASSCGSGCTGSSCCTHTCTSGRCTPDCQCDCTIDCNGHPGECIPRCRSGSSCEVDCRGVSGDCDVYCDSGASCLVRCAGAARDCGFDACATVNCGGGVFVCNRSCP